MPWISVAVVQPDRVRQLLAADRYAASLGIRLVEADGQRIVLEMPVTADLLNFLDVTHGGAVFSLADCAMSLASNVGEQRAFAVDTHLVISGSSSEGDVLQAIAEPAVGGRTLGTHQITVTRDDGRVVGLFTGTVLRVGPSDE